MMTKLSELIDITQSHLVTIKGSSGKILLELSLFWALLIAIAAPQALLLAALLYLVDVIEIEYDGRPLEFPPAPVD
jgi:predicted DNA-binding ribbon-helix-helix protein